MISIIVSIYNGERYLNRCFESLKNQTCKDFEIVLVNDGSKDLSKKLCEDFTKKNDNTILVNKENGGLSSARLEGYKKSNGEYIIFIDCDDYLEYDFIESYNNVIKNNNHIDLVISDYIVVDGGGVKNNVSMPLTKGINKANIIENFLVPSISRKWNENAGIPNFLWIRCIKKSLIDESFFISERICYTEDILFNMMLNLKIENYYYLNKPLYNYCVNEESLTTSYRNDMWKMFKYRYDWIYSFCSEHNILDISKERINVLLWYSVTQAFDNASKLPNLIKARKIMKNIRNDEVCKKNLNYMVKLNRNNIVNRIDKIKLFLIKYRMYILYYFIKH